MSSKDAYLYGVQRPTKKSSGKDISSSNSLAFTSQLSSLISDPASSRDRTSSRSRQKKDDIFHTANRNTKKRALKDLESGDNPAFAQKHTTSGEALDQASWHRSKRKMEEKARLYAAMKRGDVDDENGKYAVDFDRKWADSQSTNPHGADHESSSDGADSSDEESRQQVSWVDELGRNRTGSKADMLRAKRQMELSEQINDRARPAVPQNVIYGDSVQSEAFNPDTVTAERMAGLAAKRDRSLTPPPDVHFDASQEVRSKGVGFMQFSLDAEERRKQMEGLERDRDETERRRGERDRRKEERREELERRRREIMERKGKRKADEFLEGFGAEIAARDTKSAEASSQGDA